MAIGFPKVWMPVASPKYHRVSPTKAGRNSNVFMDCSNGRDRKATFDNDVVPCITPGHDIYSALLKRYVTPVECLGLQAIWECDIANKTAFHDMVDVCGRDMAGNSFTGTVAQAVLLAQFAASPAWIDLELPANANVSPLVPSPAGLPSSAPEPDSDTVQPEPTAQPSRKRKAPEADAEAASETKLVPIRRLRGKQCPDGNVEMQPVLPSLKRSTSKKDLVLKKRKGKKGATIQQKQGKVGGNTAATGKSSMVTIWEKEQIFAEYEKIKSTGVPKPLAVLEAKKMKGYYAGCLCSSKWGMARQQQQWPLLVEAAPKLCKRFKELPNSLRVMLQLPQKSNHALDMSETDRCLPRPLKLVVEGLIMDRVECGEEVDMAFVRRTIVYCTDLWNECVHAIRGMMQTKSMEMLREHDSQYAEMSQDQLDAVFKDLCEKINALLVTIDISRSEAALRRPGCIFLCACTNGTSYLEILFVHVWKQNLWWQGISMPIQCFGMMTSLGVQIICYIFTIYIYICTLFILIVSSKNLIETIYIYIFAILQQDTQLLLCVCAIWDNTKPVLRINRKHRWCAKTITRKQAERLCSCFGIVMKANEKPGAHLPYNHPKLEAVRVKVREVSQKEIIIMSKHEHGSFGNTDLCTCGCGRYSLRSLMHSSV